MNIGELFIKLGVQQSADFKKLPSDLSKIGASADKAMGMIGAAAERNEKVFGNFAMAVRHSAGQIKNSIGSLSSGLREASSDFSQMASSAESAANRISRAMAKAAHSEAEAVRAAGLAMRSKGGRGVGAGFFKDPNTQFEREANLRNPSAKMGPQRPRHAILRALEDDLGGRGEGASDGYLGHDASLSNRPHPGVGPVDNREYFSSRDPHEAVFSGGGVPKQRKGFLSHLRGQFGNGGGRRGGGGGRGGGRFDGPVGQVAGIRRLILGAGIFQGAQIFGGLSDTYAQLQMRLVGLTGSQEKATEVFGRLRDVAKNTKSSLESTTEGYVRIRNATASMNLSEEDSYKLMTNLNTMLATSGASAEEAHSGMMQLTQAFAKGKLDGDEFRSMAENMPNILKALSKHLGKTEGQLRAMSTAGGLTREKLVKMLLGLKNLQQPVDTFSTKWQAFKDNLMVSFGEFTKTNNLVENFGIVLTYVADILMNQIIPAVATAVKFFKEHETVTKALVAVGLASFFFSIAKSIFGFPLGVLWKIITAYREFAAAKALADGVGGIAGGAAGGAAKAAGKSGLLKKALPFLAGVVGDLLPPVAAALIVNELSDHKDPFANMKGALNNPSDNPMQHLMPDVYKASQAGGSGGNTSIGDITVNIQASDMTDAKEKFGGTIEDLLRHAAASGGGR